MYSKRLTAMLTLSVRGFCRSCCQVLPKMHLSAYPAAAPVLNPLTGTNGEKEESRHF